MTSSKDGSISSNVVETSADRSSVAHHQQILHKQHLQGLTNLLTMPNNTGEV